MAEFFTSKKTKKTNLVYVAPYPTPKYFQRL